MLYNLVVIYNTYVTMSFCILICSFITNNYTAQIQLLIADSTLLYVVS